MLSPFVDCRAKRDARQGIIACLGVRRPFPHMKNISFETGDHIDARDFGVVLDGQTDNTGALQNALDACGDRGGGVVRLPAGLCAIAGHVTVPNDVTLEGVATSPRRWMPGRGATLLAYEGRGEEDGAPFIALCANAVLKGLAVHYPEQSGSEVAPYPWCVEGGEGGDAAVIDCLLVNPYQGIHMGRHMTNRHLISRVFGSPLRRGILVDRVVDIGRIDTVHFWPFYPESMGNPVFRSFVQSHGEAFIFGRTDWQHVLNTFCWGYRVGYRFIEGDSGVCNGNFIGLGADACNVSVWVENSAPYGLLISNGEFVAIFGENPVQICVDQSHNGTVQFNNCAFWGLSDQCAHVAGDGFVSFNQCHFLDWRSQLEPKACVKAVTGQIAVNGCRFGKAGEAIRIGKDVKGAVIAANMFSGENAVVLEEGAHAAVTGNLVAKPRYITPEDSFIVDIRGQDVALEGFWPNQSNRSAFHGHYYFTRGGRIPSSCRWNFPPQAQGPHTLSVWIPDQRGHHADETTYVVHTPRGDSEVRLRQRDFKGQWAPLGVFDITPDSYVTLSVASSGIVLADALMGTRVPRGAMASCGPDCA